MHVCMYTSLCVVSLHIYSKDIRCSCKYSLENSKTNLQTFCRKGSLTKNEVGPIREHAVMIHNVHSGVLDCIAGGQAGEDQQQISSSAQNK
jgi:hypothetical protein